MTIIFVKGQPKDSLPKPADSFLLKKGKEICRVPEGVTTLPAEKVTATQIIIPSALIIYGFVTIENNSLRSLDKSTRYEITEDHTGFRTKADNYLQYSPALTVYSLNAAGIRGKNNLRDRTMLYLLSTIISGVTVRSLKAITKIERPDGSGNDSYPSGHTTTAFAAAEFLRQEYKNVSPYYGIGGYLAAAATGILRLYNNKHWLSDVVAGAGFGILSTKTAYWIYPFIKRKLFKNKSLTTIIVPFYQNATEGLSLIYSFNCKHL